MPERRNVDGRVEEDDEEGQKWHRWPQARGT